MCDTEILSIFAQKYIPAGGFYSNAGQNDLKGLRESTINTESLAIEDKYFNIINFFNICRMNKKFLGALLIGALTVTSTGTLVSCKDYDDDITNLQNQIDANKSAIEKIEALIKSGSVITNVTQDGAGVKFTLSNGQSYTVSNGKDGVAGATGAAGKDADVWTIGTDGYWYKNAEKTDFYALGSKGDKGDQGEAGAQGPQGPQGPQGEAGAPGEAGHYYRPNTNGTFDEYKADGTFVKHTDISWLGMGISAVDYGTYVTLGNVVINGELKTIRVAKGAALRALVFNPEEYYQGIEAIQVDAYEYNPITLFKLDAKKPLHLTQGTSSSLDPKNFTDVSTDDKVSYVPNVSLGYYLNPSNALVDLKDVSKFNFIVKDVNYTRANDFLFGNDFQVNSVEADQATKGLVYVNASVNENNQAIKNILENKAVTVAALRYNDGDTVVTSDFAALHRALTNEFDIIYGADRSGMRFAGYITNNAIEEAKAAYYDNNTKFSVAYNESFDFNTTIRAAYKPNGEEMQVMSYRKQKAAGFEFQYELVPFTLGEENTDQNAHVKLENSVLTPVNKRSSIGRIALVRVKLVDTKHDNKVVSVGYAAVKITDVKAEPIDGGTFSFNNKYELVCGTNDFATLKVTWDQMESIFDKLGISREEFQKTYCLDCESRGTTDVAKQFPDMVTDQPLDQEHAFGVVNKTVRDNLEDETNVLVWTISNNEAYDFVANKENVEKNVIVRFVPRENTTKYNNVYVTLTWKPASRKITPAWNITMADKVVSTWFDGVSANKGEAALHAHVEAAKADAKDNFVFSVGQSTFKNAAGQSVSDPVEVLKEKLIAAGYEDLANSAKLVYKFDKGVTLNAGSAVLNRADYYLVGCTDNAVFAQDARLESNVTVTGTKIAEINNITGVITYLKNKVAEDILNYAAHSELAKGKTFEAPVIITATTCAPAKDAITMTGNKFFVKFLRPITVTSAAATIIDSKPSSYKANATFNFIDWRDYDNKKVCETSNNAFDLFDYYKVESIEQDKDRKVTSNFSGTWAELNTKDFVVTYSGVATLMDGVVNDKVKTFGTINYEKKTTVAVHDFQVKVPVVIKYDWGKIYTEIVVNINKTDNN